MFIEYEYYYRSTSTQKSNEWLNERLCSLTASMASTWSNRSNFNPNLYDEAKYICGLEKKVFPLNQQENIDLGVLNEPLIFNWYKNKINIDIPEVGLSIWKKDFRFRASLDADPIDENFFAEFKAPKHLYRNLIEYTEAVNKGFNPPPGFHEHIYDSHFDQITVSGVIHNKVYCDYVVFGIKTNEIYSQRIIIDYEHFYDTLYPEGIKFYDKYITPLMKKHNLKRIDPHENKN